MKNLIGFIALMLFLFPNEVYSQDNTSGNFQIQVNYLNVKGKIRGGNDSGMGIGAEYHFNLVQSIGLQGLGGIGYEKIFGNCPLCDSEWFEHGFWAGVGLSKRFQITEKHGFIGQVRYRRIGFEKMEPAVLELDGNIIRWERFDRFEELLGLKLGYFLPIKLPVVLSYTFENGAFHRMNAISLGFQF
ncbi:MAG: hypothetical protein ACXIUQ_04290 [Cecembia sp.]